MGRLLVLDRDSGQVKRRYSPVNAGSDPCIDSDGSIITTLASELVAIDGASYKKLWAVDLQLGILASAPSIGSDGMVYIADGRGKVHAVR